MILIRNPLNFLIQLILNSQKLLMSIFWTMVCLFSLATSGTDRFDVGDIIDVNATISNLVQMGSGHYQFELSPDDNSSPANLFVKINGSGVKTDGFGDTFQDANFSFDYNPQNPVILSSTFPIGHGVSIRVLRSILQVLLQLPYRHSHRDLNTMLVANESLVYLSRVVNLRLQSRHPIRFFRSISLMS